METQFLPLVGKQQKVFEKALEQMDVSFSQLLLGPAFLSKLFSFADKFRKTK